MSSRREFLALVGSALWPPVSPAFALQIIVVKQPWEAEAIIDRLNAGEAFDRLAQEYSIDPSASRGGYIPQTSLVALRPEVRNAVQGLRSGQLTDVVKTPFGHAIIRVLTQTRDSDIDRTAALPEYLQAGQNLRYTTEVGAFFKAVKLFKHFQKVGDQQNLRGNCQSRMQALSTEFKYIKSYLARPADQLTAAGYQKTIDAHETLAQFWSYQGNMEKAIEQFQLAYELASNHQLRSLQLELLEKLGISEMRRGENENCVHGRKATCCIFPLCHEARHKQTSGSGKAIGRFAEYLSRDPDDTEVKWLLNLASMTLGTYPDGIPKEYLIPSSAFESKDDIGRFTDVAPSLGLDVFHMAGGVIVDDFDNDGLLDVVFSSFDSCGPLRYFRNNGDGTFMDRAAKAGLSDQLGGLNIVQTDYNNDGLLDIFIMRGAWELPIRNSLLRNNGDGTFTDVTHQAGLAVPAHQTLSAAWADFDNDGYLDLFVGNELTRSQLFHNNGDGTFTDVSHVAGVDRIACTKGVTVGDYDNDGYPDIYVSNLGSDNFLYHNNRDGTFTEVARQLLVELPVWSFPAWFFDFNNDGWLDLFVSNYTFSLSEVLRSALRQPVSEDTMRLYRNTGQGTFQNVTREVGLDRVLMPMGSNFGDLDNDGFLDFYLGTGGPSYGALVPNILFRNHEGEKFVDITASSGTGHLQKGHAVAFADINNDGNQDIFAEIGGATPGDKYYSALFKNPGQNRNNWIKIKLSGVKTNRAAIGARIKVIVENEDGARREIHRSVTSGGSFGASPLEQHIGLGKASGIKALEIWWPTSNTHQVFESVAANQVLEIREFDKKYTTIQRRTFALPTV